jgi:hypothetical protein
VKVEVREVRETDDGWVGRGNVVDETKSVRSPIRVTIRLSKQGAEQSRDAILKGSTRMVEFDDGDVVEASIS